MAISIGGIVDKGINKAVNYGNKYLNDKLNYGLNYASNYLRQFDILGLLPEQWTILDENGEKAFEFDAFISADIKNECKVTQKPVEEGSFASYHMTTAPLSIKCVLAKQGFPQDLTAITDALLNYVDSTALLSVITPEQEYEDMKLTGFSFSRAADKGCDIIYAECTFEQVRIVESEYSNAKIAQKQNRGLQQGNNNSQQNTKSRSVLRSMGVKTA